MRDRVRPPAELEYILDNLKDKEGLFATKQKGIMFAAAFGHVLNEMGEELPDDLMDGLRFGEGIRLEYFRRPDDDESFIDALAVAVSGSLDILAEDRGEERLEIFERYACWGLGELQRRLQQDSRGALDVVVDILDELGGETPVDGGTRIDRLKGLL